jgi:hypothetical protein
MHGLLLFTALLTMAVLLYGLYQLNQRVMRLEASKRHIASEKAAKAKAPTPVQGKNKAEIFHDLEGEELFYAMTGDYRQELEFSEDARKRFELVIRKHLLEVLEKAKNGERALDSETIIRTLRGPVRSWLPQDIVSSLLIQGGILGNDPKDETAIGSIRSTIARVYLQLGYQSPDNMLGLDDQTADPPEESVEEPKRPLDADEPM